MLKFRFKRVLALVIAVALLVGGTGAAAARERENEVTPVILVPGYSSASLFLDYGTEDERRVWGLDFDAIITYALNNIANIGLGIGGLTVGKTELMTDLVGTDIFELCKELACNPDGSSKNELTVGAMDPQESCYAYIADKYGKDNVTEPVISKGFVDIIGEENLFIYYTDFRMSAIDCAEDLHNYVQNVKEYTGSDKVSIYAISHGGQVTGTYLSLYGDTDSGDLDNVVMNVPALGGAGIAYDVLTENVKLDEKLLVYYVQRGLVSETNFEWLMSAQRLGILDKLANELVNEYLRGIFGYWGSIWDFIPAQFYDDVKEKYLDSAESRELIEKSDRMHYEIMPSFADSFARVREQGVNVSIMSSCGSNIVTGLMVNSDAIIPTDCSSGALCAPYGKRFSDGYTCKGTVCSNPEHHHLSPSMEIDASCGWLPENTWFVEGQFHGMSVWDEYTRELAKKLVFTHDIVDIYSDPAYPQFGLTHNPTDSLYIEFDKSAQGFVTADDTTLSVTNLSQKYSVRLLSVSCEGLDIKFKTVGTKKLAPGETVELKIIGEVPDVNLTRASITVNFLQIGALSALSTRTFDYTVLGGSYTPTFDADSPYSDADTVSEYDSGLMRILDKAFSALYLGDLLRIIYTTVVSLFDTMFK